MGSRPLSSASYMEHMHESWIVDPSSTTRTSLQNYMESQITETDNNYYTNHSSFSTISTPALSTLWSSIMFAKLTPVLPIQETKSSKTPVVGGSSDDDACLGLLFRQVEQNHQHLICPTSDVIQPRQPFRRSILAQFFCRSSQPHYGNKSGNSCSSVGRLSEKYGKYVTPERHGSTHKTMGATSKKNVASGATAVIRLVLSQDGNTIVAVKKFKKPEKGESSKAYMKRMHNEYCISKVVSTHPNIVKTFDLLIDEKNRWCTVMEYCAGGDLFTLLSERRLTMPVMEQACLFKQLLLGLQHVHACGIAHRDIKPENLVLTAGGTLKIADFGVAHVVKNAFQNESQQSYHWCGSSEFWSPEIWTLKNDEQGYDGQALDIWSAGITFFCMRFGYLPFKASFYRPPRVQEGELDVVQPYSPAYIAAHAQDSGDLEFGIYRHQRAARDPSSYDLWIGGSSQLQTRHNNGKQIADTKLSDKERECLSGLLDINPTTRWTVDQALRCDWMKSDVEMCDDGKLPNGWRHYHHISSSLSV